MLRCQNHKSSAKNKPSKTDPGQPRRQEIPFETPVSAMAYLEGEIFLLAGSTLYVLDYSTGKIVRSVTPELSCRALGATADKLLTLQGGTLHELDTQSGELTILSDAEFIGGQGVMTEDVFPARPSASEMQSGNQ